MSGPETTKVHHAMCKNPSMIDGLASVSKAIEIMEESGLDALVIDKRDAEDEYGLISMSMIARHVFACNRNPKRVSVYEIMEKPTVILPAKMQARYAIRLLTRLGMKHAIVTEEDKTVGSVNIRGLVLAEYHAQSSEKAQLPAPEGD